MAVFVVVQMRGPFGSPAMGLPLLDFIDKSTVTGSEILCTQIQRAGIAALARHAPAAASTFIKKMNRITGLVQRVGG